MAIDRDIAIHFALARRGKRASKQFISTNNANNPGGGERQLAQPPLAAEAFLSFGAKRSFKFHWPMGALLAADARRPLTRARSAAAQFMEQ